MISVGCEKVCRERDLVVDVRVRTLYKGSMTTTQTAPAATLCQFTRAEIVRQTGAIKFAVVELDRLAVRQDLTAEARVIVANAADAVLAGDIDRAVENTVAVAEDYDAIVAMLMRRPIERAEAAWAYALALRAGRAHV